MINLKTDPNETWARVELWRWQYGALPKPGDMRPLNVSTALRRMAGALNDGVAGQMPTLGNTVSVIKYVAELLEPKKLQTAKMTRNQRKAKKKKWVAEQ